MSPNLFARFRNCVFNISHYKRTLFSRDRVFIAQVKMECAPFLLNAVHSHTMFVPRPKSVTSRTYDRKAHESTAKKLPTVIEKKSLLKRKIQKLLKSQLLNSRKKSYAFSNARGGSTNNVQIVKKCYVRGESR